MENGIYTSGGRVDASSRMWSYQDGVWYLSTSQGWSIPIVPPPTDLVKVAR